jgi:hypothetical protein
MLFILLGNDVCADTEVRRQLNKSHVFGQLALSLHLPQIFVVLLAIFWI